MSHFFNPRSAGAESFVMGQVSHGAYAWSVNELVCLDLPGGSQFVDSVKRAWDAGDAIFPIDQRLAPPAKRAVLDAIKPTVVVTAGDVSRHPGQPVETGDAVVVATSGTTGSPRGVVLTHDAVSASARATSQRLGVQGSDCWLSCLPLSHVGGLSVVMRSLVTGTPLIVEPQFSVEAYESAAARGATLVSLVPTALQRVDPSRYRLIVLGGSRPPADRPANCIATYGLTETGSGVVYDGLPLEGVEIRIDDGIIHLRAPMLLRAYRDGGRARDADGWFRTGDMGSINDDGTLTVAGREGDLIITGGENVWPEAVEDALRGHPSIADLCVAGVPDAEWGQEVNVWVVTNPGTTISLDEIRERVKATIAPHCAPRRLHLVPDIPRTSLGKARRSALVRSVSQ